MTRESMTGTLENEAEPLESQPMMTRVARADGSDGAQVDVAELVASLTGWRDAMSALLEGMPAEAFERLFLRLLGEDGIHDIALSGLNESIEGIGIVGGGGFFSFRVAFKCIRGGGRISSGEVEEFRRAVMVGRADRGLLITTGKFTKEAMLKAASDRAPELKLIDGERFIDKLKELRLGVSTEMVTVERVVIDEAWFAAL